MQIPDYLIYDDIKRREEREKRDGGLTPLHLPLYRPEPDEAYHDDAESGDDSERGVVIIDITSGEEVSD